MSVFVVRHQHPAERCPAADFTVGGCATAMPAADHEEPILNPEEACLAAIDAGLLVRRAYPLNCETPLPALTGGVAMPTAKFYVRNHFGIPDLDPASWRLHLGGLVERPISLGLAQLRAMPSASAVITLECAGNGRAALHPPVPGEGNQNPSRTSGKPITLNIRRIAVFGPLSLM